MVTMNAAEIARYTSEILRAREGNRDRTRCDTCDRWLPLSKRHRTICKPCHRMACYYRRKNRP